MQQCVVWCGPILAALNLAGEIRFMDPSAPSAPTETLVGHRSSVSCLFSVPGSSEFLTGGADGLLLKWPVSAGSAIGAATKVIGFDPATRSSHNGRVVGCGTSAAGAIISAGWDDKVNFAESAAMVVGTGAATNGQPTAFGCCSTTGLVAIGTSEGVVQFFKDGAELFSVPVGSAPQALALNHDETVLALGLNDKISIMAIDLEKMTLTATKLLEGHRGAISTLAFSPNGSLLAAGDANREIKLWDASADWTTKVSGKWVFHTSTINCLAWAPGGDFLASGSNDQSVFIWNPAKVMKKVQIRFAHKGGVTGIGYLDDKTIATGGADGAVAIWNVAP